MTGAPAHGTGRRRGDEGFALMAVLWVLAGIAALALVARLSARDAVQSAGNRADLAVARWRAEDCVARARAAASAALREAPTLSGPGAWGRLDELIARSPLLRGAPCRASVRAAGAGLDVNRADGESLRRFFAALGQPAASADSLADALQDWRDPDVNPRPAGAEAPGYLAAGAAPPRDGPFADPRELARVRGFERFGAMDTLVALEGGRVPLSRAPAAVLAALPGITPEALSRIADMRARGRAPDLPSLMPLLSRPAGETLMSAYAELAPLVSAEPEVWAVTARGREGTPPMAAVVEVWLGRAGGRAAVVRRRSWIE